MARFWLCFVLSGLWVGSCGPGQRECTGAPADFSVVLRLRDRPLPADTVVHVTYGGSGTEDYSLADRSAKHEIVFCHPSDNVDCTTEADAASLLSAAGAAGDESGVQALCCELYTGGFANLEVSATGLTTTTYELTPREHVCTVTQTIVLDSPDGG